MLQIKGKGDVDGAGLTIDDVKLIKVGSSDNLVVNGGFENPPQNGLWKILDNIEGWKGVHIEIGNGKLYNSRWNSQVCELDSDSMNIAITQSFFLDDRIEYVLSYDWAPRTAGVYKVNFASYLGSVSIGNQKIADMSADALNPGVRHMDIVVLLVAGPNSITFTGLGDSDGQGITVSNVVLRRRDGLGAPNVLVNGNFATPNVGTAWQIINGGINGWTANVVEIGYCKNYNNSWQGGQCIELDSTSNQAYTQNFTA